MGLDRESRLRSLAAYAGGVALCCALLAIVLRLWQASWNVPLDPRGGDATYTAMQFKTILETGWILHNSRVGMPSGLDLHPLIIADGNLHFLIAKFLSYVLPDAVLILNVYFVATFPLTVITSLFVFRSVGISYIPAMVGSLAFCFLPYHFLRGEAHLFLAAYYLIPLIVLVILWISRQEVFFGSAGPLQGGRLPWLTYYTVPSVAICCLTGLGGAYYAFFGIFFLAIAGVLGSLRAGHWRPLITSGIVVVLVGLTFLANLEPNLVYRWREGLNSAVPARQPGEAEFYGLKIAQLLLPIEGHRVSLFRRIRDKYDRTSLMPRNENRIASLGFFGSAGFLLLLGWVFWSLSRQQYESPTVWLLTDLSVLNLAGLLLGTMGGFGSILALLGLPEIRAYNRISIYLGFFSIFAAVITLDQLALRLSPSKRGRLLRDVTIALIIVAAILDQTSNTFVPPYPQLKATYASDEAFIGQIESSVPAGAMIFQLPYVPFFENPRVQRMFDYDHFRGYLHSHALRWSYGAMRGTKADAWQAQVVMKPVNVMLADIALAGFDGLYVDRYGYSDLGAGLIEELSGVLGKYSFMSSDGRLVFFSLSSFRATLLSH